MKKIEIKGKLSLNKSTIANLNDNQMNSLKGGAPTKSEMKCAPESLLCDYTRGCGWTDIA